MKICFVGKYPPIQGGTSSESYWAVRGLAEAGHEVSVVTNATEVEAAYRIQLEPADLPELTPSFPNGGAVRVFHPEHVSRRMTHIPMSNPFVSKLSGLATQVVREYGADVVVGSYFEPYGVAASLAAHWTRTPLLLQHAGSDLDRLTRIPELATTYRQLLAAADGVITRPSLFPRFLGLGVRPSALRTGPPYAMPPPFSPHAAPMTATEIMRLAAAGDGPVPSRPVDLTLPTIGMYGKPGEFKGTYDLIAALGMLRSAGMACNLLLLSGAAQRSQLTAAIEAAGLAEHTWRLPFVAHWRVPGFVRACTAVCFLERGFPVAIHGPVVPHEVLTTGTCLVLSGEIQAKQPRPERFVDGDNVVLVPDPRDRESLAKRLRTVIESPSSAAEIGARGRLVAAEFAPYRDFVTAWQALIESALRAPAASAATRSVVETLDAVLPWARPLLGEEFDGLVEAFGRVWGGPHGGDAAADLRLAEVFCGFLADRSTGPLRDAARYQLARGWSMGSGAPEPHPRPVDDALRGRVPDIDTIRDLYPFRAVPVRLERFDHDVTPVFCHSEGGPATDLAALPAGPVTVAFARLPSLAPTELRMNQATVGLLDQCTGTDPAGTLVDRLSADRSSPDRSSPDRSGPWRHGPGRHDVVVALGRLYAAGLVGFADAAVTATPVVRGR